MNCRPSPSMIFALAVMCLAACGGGGGGGSDSDPIVGGLAASFLPDPNFIASCPSGLDSLNMREAGKLGDQVTIGLQVTDCDGSMGIYAVNFEISFNPVYMQCAGANPCSAGTVLGSPNSGVACSCNNAAGTLLGSYSKLGMGGNETVNGTEEIVRFTLRGIKAGAGVVQFQNKNSSNGTALLTYSGSPQVIPGLSYGEGSVIVQ